MRLLSVKWKPRFEYHNFQIFVPLDFSKSSTPRMRFNKSCYNKATDHIATPPENVCMAISFPNNLVLFI